jgi:hypothetical protein
MGHIFLTLVSTEFDHHQGKCCLPAVVNGNNTFTLKTFCWKIHVMLALHYTEPHVK